MPLGSSTGDVFQNGYWRCDLTGLLKVGVDAVVGFEDTQADLVSHVETVALVPTRVSATRRGTLRTGRECGRALLPYLTR